MHHQIPKSINLQGTTPKAYCYSSVSLKYFDYQEQNHSLNNFHNYGIYCNPM